MDLGERKSHPVLPTSEKILLNVEGLNDARTPHGKRRVSARLGGAGETSDFFSILLGQGFELWQTWAGMVNEGKQGRPTLECGTVHVLPNEMA
jgi:hypothetical protein